MNLTVIWRFLFGAFELIHISVCKEKNCNNDAENVTNHCTKFGCLHVQAPGTCVPRTVSTLSHQVTVHSHCHLSVQTKHLTEDHITFRHHAFSV